MTRLVVKNAIEYYAASKSPTFAINIPDAMMMQAGVVFRSNNTVNEDGSFDVTIVPWENVVSFTHAMLPPVEEEQEPEHEQLRLFDKDDLEYDTGGSNE